MYFEGAYLKKWNVAGVILVLQEGISYKFTFKLNLNYTNNVVEYEALILGLNIASGYGIKFIKVCGDWELVVSQIRGIYY